jgi:hypothetical protein
MRANPENQENIKEEIIGCRMNEKVWIEAKR